MTMDESHDKRPSESGNLFEKHTFCELCFSDGWVGREEVRGKEGKGKGSRSGKEGGGRWGREGRVG